MTRTVPQTKSEIEAGAGKQNAASAFAAPPAGEARDGPQKRARGARPGSQDITPMMAQYFEIKRAHPDCLLFYRMGDFYELFHDDAVKAADALDITLTRRGKHEGEDIPMCGVPVHSHEAYLARLIRKGFKVAVADQTEDPAEARRRGGKALVRRDVVRVVTAGTLTEDSLLDARRHNFLAAVSDVQGALALAWIDISTGDFQMQPIGRSDRRASGSDATSLGAALARLDPGEILLPEKLLTSPALFEVFGEWKARLTPLPNSRFDSENARRRLEALYGVKALDAFGDFGRAEISAAGAAVDYVELTQKGRMPRLSAPRRFAAGAVLEIDPATMRNLEIFRSLGNERSGSLLGAVDLTVSGAGARLLAAHIASPLTDCQAIAKRLDMVTFFVEEEARRGQMRDLLRRCPDIERALSRLTLGRGGPRDLIAVREALQAARNARGVLENAGSPLAEGIDGCFRDLGCHGELIDRLTRALAAEVPHLARDGGFIAASYAPELDELRALRDESRRLITRLQNRYAKETSIPSLKIRHNNVLGYFVEVTATHVAKLPLAPDGPFVHRQTMTGASRFTTAELSELESRITGAADKALALELKLFDDLVGEIAARAESLSRAARALAALDVASANAELAVLRRYCRPLVDESCDFEIEAGRHPVVEIALEDQGAAPFTRNDCDLAEERRLWLVTGPNMAGKSTFLRQNALIAVLAQAGLYVPADAARIGVVDRLFSRVGAADDLARGRSTFMVEMVETAAILNQAGPRTLVILDEIGRGTATFDGLSIAWACVEHLHEVNRCRTLFATHYHELASLAAKLPALSLHTMRVKEWRGEVVFLHEVTGGVAEGSYGIHVAELAGLPAATVQRARQVLANLERGEQAGILGRLADDLPLFSSAATRTAQEAAGPSPLEEALAAVKPDELTPKEALELLYKLRNLAGD